MVLLFSQRTLVGWLNLCAAKNSKSFNYMYCMCSISKRIDWLIKREIHLNTVYREISVPNSFSPLLPPSSMVEFWNGCIFLVIITIVFEFKTGQNSLMDKKAEKITGRKQPFIQYFSVFWPSPLTTRLRWLWGAVGFHTTKFWSREPVANRVESGDQSTHVALAEWVGSLNTSCKCKNCHSYQ